MLRDSSDGDDDGENGSRHREKEEDDVFILDCLLLRDPLRWIFEALILFWEEIPAFAIRGILRSMTTQPLDQGSFCRGTARCITQRCNVRHEARSTLAQHLPRFTIAKHSELQNLSSDTDPQPFNHFLFCT